MERHRTIDTTLRERHDILDLLERLKKEHITIDEMEEIGARLRKAGRRALSPLVRRLWREKSGDLISRYTYLLDFFEDEPWLDQLVAITLSRKDLDEEGRRALLAALEGYGIDVTSPPFAKLLDETGGPLRITLPRLLDKGDKGLVIFMEEFVSCDTEAQRAIVRELPLVEDPRVVGIFSLLLGFDEPETIRETIETLGRVRDPEAAALLRRFMESAAADYGSLAERSLRRLAFLGIDPGPSAAVAPLPFRSAFVSPVDAAGLSCVAVARWNGSGGIDLLFMELHETEGMREAWGWSGIGPEKYDEIVRENRIEDTFVAADPAWAAELVRDAISRSVAAGFYLPPEFYVRQGIFAGIDLTPAPYVPSFAGIDLEMVATPARIAAGEELLDDGLFDGWYVFTGRTRLLADELARLGEADPFARNDVEGIDRFLERWCREQLAPRLERIVRRLFLAADLMLRAGREQQRVELVLATALSLSRAAVPLHRHPFLRRWLVEMIEMVREARAEGYEFPPPHGDDEDDEGWE